MHPMFEEMRPKAPDEGRLIAWSEGQTGYPIIDSCMRCVKQTGWLPFRMRAMLVSFASYHLWLDWRATAPVLARYFTDFEPGIHYSQFQMQSGVTGINTIRIYNPVKQSYDHDKHGVFIKKYVPELTRLPEQWVHEPHRMSAELSQRFGVEIGTDYPYPIVDNAASIREAKSKMAEHKRHPKFGDISAAIFQKLGSRNRPPTLRKPKPVQTLQQLSLF
jgi:deoxyribodipyrimidine photo-lyase